MENDITVFLYSQKTVDHETEINKKLNKIYTPMKVLHEGKWKPFTHRTKTPDIVQNSITDARIVARIKDSEIKISS